MLSVHCIQIEKKTTQEKDLLNVQIGGGFLLRLRFLRRCLSLIIDVVVIKLLNECDNLAALIIVRDNLIAAIIFGDLYDSLSTCSSRKYARNKCF